MIFVWQCPSTVPLILLLGPLAPVPSLSSSLSLSLKEKKKSKSAVALAHMYHKFISLHLSYWSLSLSLSQQKKDGLCIMFCGHQPKRYPLWLISLRSFYFLFIFFFLGTVYLYRIILFDINSPNIWRLYNFFTSILTKKDIFFCLSWTPHDLLDPSVGSAFRHRN